MSSRGLLAPLRLAAVIACVSVPGAAIAQASQPAPDEEPAAAPVQEATPVEEAAPAEEASAGAVSSAKSAGHPHHSRPHLTFAGFQLNGRFDLAYEMGGFAIDGEGDPENSVKNYHHFLFLSRNQPDDWYSFTIELVDLSFYEFAIPIGDKYGVRFGKVLVPFGQDPLFHHSYGGLSGIDQKTVPFVWAEHGGVFEANLVNSGQMTLDLDVYAVAGVAGSDDAVVRLTGASDPGTIALGDRVRFGYGKYAAALSAYWDRYTEGRDLFIWGFDASAGYGFIPAPVLENLSLRLGLLRADVDSETLGDYYHFANYLQLDYRLPAMAGLRYRTGIQTFENHEGLFFDDRDERKTADDTMAHSLMVWKRHRGVTFAGELIINIEQAGETDNDLMRLFAAVDF